MFPQYSAIKMLPPYNAKIIYKKFPLLMPIQIHIKYRMTNSQNIRPQNPKSQIPIYRPKTIISTRS